MKTFYVYELVRKTDGKVIYVGKGCGRRMHHHRWHVERGHWKVQGNLYQKLKALRDSGDDFEARKVFESDDELAVLNKEIELINKYGIDNLLNGVSSKLFGAVSSERAEATRQAISRARTGMKFSDEHKENIRKANLARPPRTDAHRRNQSLGQTGKKRGPYKNKLAPEESRKLRLAKYRRHYQKHREAILAKLQYQRDAARQSTAESIVNTLLES